MAKRAGLCRPDPGSAGKLQRAVHGNVRAPGGHGCGRFGCFQSTNSSADLVGVFRHIGFELDEPPAPNLPINDLTLLIALLLAYFLVVNVVVRPASAPNPDAFVMSRYGMTLFAVSMHVVTLAFTVAMLQRRTRSPAAGDRELPWALYVFVGLAGLAFTEVTGLIVVLVQRPELDLQGVTAFWTSFLLPGLLVGCLCSATAFSATFPQAGLVRNFSVVFAMALFVPAPSRLRPLSGFPIFGRPKIQSRQPPLRAYRLALTGFC